VVARPRRLLVIPLGANTNPLKKLARLTANAYLTETKRCGRTHPRRAVIAEDACRMRASAWDPGPPMRLLIIEDDHDAADYLTKAFREVGHVAERAFDGEEGLALALDTPYDVLIVDRMLPKLDGLNLIGQLRAKGVTTPALILSALGQVDDRVKGLRAGSDDYLSKPYAFSELLARVEVLARRRGGRGEDTVYRVGDLELDRLSHRVSRAEAEIVLQPREFRLLEYLMKHAGQVVTRTMLLENVWDYHFDPQTNVIDVHISRLRSKIDKGFARPLLHTVRGAGYMIRDGAR
jgi:two-component system, OmpR family, response regulator